MLLGKSVWPKIRGKHSRNLHRTPLVLIGIRTESTMSAAFAENGPTPALTARKMPLCQTARSVTSANPVTFKHGHEVSSTIHPLTPTCGMLAAKREISVV